MTIKMWDEVKSTLWSCKPVRSQNAKSFMCDLNASPRWSAKTGLAIKLLLMNCFTNPLIAPAQGQCRQHSSHSYANSVFKEALAERQNTWGKILMNY